MKYQTLFKLLAFLSSSLFIYSCENDKNQETIPLSYQNLKIDYTFRCDNFCIHDNLSLQGQKVAYTYQRTCTTPTYKKNIILSQGNAKSLLGLIDFEAFKKINLDKCYICVDGCDYELIISNGVDTHRIRFGDVDLDSTQMVPIKSFVLKLNDIKSYF